MEDAVAGRRVVRLLHAVHARELAADRGLSRVVLAAREDEVVVGDGGLARIDRRAAGDLVEGVDREGRRAIGGGKQIRPDAQRRPRLDRGVAVDAVRPDDLLGRRHGAGRLGIRKEDFRLRPHRGAELAAADGEDAAGDPDLFFLGREGNRRVGLALRFVGQDPCRRIERERVAVARVLDGLGALDDVEPEVEGVSPENVAHVPAADDDELQPLFFGDALQSGRAHLARGADREALAGDQERLAAVHPRAEVRHEVAERARLPAFIERLEALRDAVGGRRDLVRVDRVALPARDFRVPEDEGLSPDLPGRTRSGNVGGTGPGEVDVANARLQSSGRDPVLGHEPAILPRRGNAGTCPYLPESRFVWRTRSSQVWSWACWKRRAARENASWAAS